MLPGWVLQLHRRRAGLHEAGREELGSGLVVVRKLERSVAQRAGEGARESGPAVLREDFAAYTRQYRLTGSFRVALDELKERLADPTADRALETLNTHT